MLDLLDKLYATILKAGSHDEFLSIKDALLTEIAEIRRKSEVNTFQYSRLIKDKNVLHSLLARTSEDLKLALHELSQRAEELNTLLLAIPALVYFKDVNLNYVIVNKAFEEFSGKRTEEIVGRSAAQVFSEYQTTTYDQIEQSVLETGQSLYDISEQLTDKGRTILLSTNLAPVKNIHGENIGLVGVSWDVTEQRKNQEALQNAKDAAEAGTRAKSEFLANMSHEIRTPLNGIIGMSQILSKSISDPPNKEYLDIIISSGQSLLLLVEDILDFSKIDAGMLTFEEKPFNVVNLMREIDQLLRIKAEDKALSLLTSVDKGLKHDLLGDEDRIKKVILNLADNAIKFTEKGKVSIDVTLQEEDTKGLTLQFTIRDTGIGIAKDQLSRIFQSFEQLDSSHTRRFGGSGLGLAISHRLVQMMGGTIKVESEPGKGSVFSFDIKLKKVGLSPSKQPGKQSPLKRKIHVLLAEDNLINQKVAAFTLNQMGLTFDLARNGIEAVEQFKTGRFDLILMDIQMPEMSGFEATQSIRSIEKDMNSPSHILIIALTANAMKGDMERCLQVGMNAYLSKPFQQKELMGLISQYFSE
ncbi:MAG: ATP-binding protein [Bacteroidales bacterium]|nr:ATP-binding protein [Bacteroidales bacterium]